MKNEEQHNTINLINRRRRSRGGSFTLHLTSMIDMFTILLVFLLKNYTSEGQIINVSRDLRLPVSTSQQQPRVMSVVAVTTEWILVDGRQVMRIDSVNAESPLVLAPLLDELRQLREVSQKIGDMSAELQGFRGSIVIQGDRDIPFEMLKRIMLTCGQVGYNNMQLAVLQKE